MSGATANGGHAEAGRGIRALADHGSERPAMTAEADQLERLLMELRTTIVGQNRLLERVVVSLLAGGHCLIEGVPGLAKTLAIETLARATGGTFSRIQLTPDLIPADIVGTRIYRAPSEEFDVELGPVFANIVLADEINRAPAKVQSALLEVMAERQVSIGGTTFPAPDPFLVLPRRTRSSPRASINCPRPSAIASSCASSSTTRAPRKKPRSFAGWASSRPWPAR